MTRPLPFHRLNAFEAAARHLSFSHAAHELNVQQPAVSRHIAALEEELGVALFIRSKPRLTLTREGRALAESIRTGFETIRDGLQNAASDQSKDTVLVSASIGFTSLWLLPRLAEFQAAYPAINLQIITRDQNDDFDPANSDVVILFGENGTIAPESQLIFREEMVAVCRADLLPDGQAFDLSSMASQKLLHLTSRDHRGDWNRFFASSGHTIAEPPAHDCYVSYMVYLRAIRSGLGIGIGWRPLLAEYLNEGTLVLACAHECETRRGYFCTVTETGTRKPAARAFQEWISHGP